jgi:hypothetical protein
MRRALRLSALLSLVALCLPVEAATADPYPVNSLANSGPGTLRQAIVDANAHPGEDSIPINVTGTIKLAEVLPPVEGNVSIVGPGASSLTVERDAPVGFRIFNFSNGITASLSGLTVTGGAAQPGGGIRNGNGNLTLIRVVVADNEAPVIAAMQAGAEGAGVYSAGPLTIRESVIRHNWANIRGGTISAFAGGGGVIAYSVVTVDRSTISNNVAEAVGEGNHAGALGGGLYAVGPAIVEGSTISGNTVLATGSLTNEARGGGLRGKELTLTNSTVTGNSLASNGTKTGANIHLGGTSLIRNTIVANPLGGGSCSTEDAPLTSGGFNLDEDGSCGFGHGSDLIGVDPLLGPLLENGGPTPTHALLTGSIAIDRGNSFGATADQRGFPRPSNFAAISDKEGGDGSDIGAFELQAPPLPSPAPLRVNQVPGDRTPPHTRIVSGPPRVTFKRLATFRFASSESQSHFQCKVDKRRWKGCASPFQRNVRAGVDGGRKHVFKVRAIDRFGNVDPTPARFGWRVEKIGR